MANPIPQRKRLSIAIGVYWFLLAYVVLALAWWFYSLREQSVHMAQFRMEQLRVLVDSTRVPGSFNQEKVKIHQELAREETKYALEGLTFLLITLFSAGYVYRSVKKQLNLQQQQRNFMMAVTHELKTPLAVAKLNLETLLKHQLDEQKRQKLLQITLQETNRLNGLASNILVSSQLEDRAHEVSMEDLNLSDLIKSAAHSFNQRFADRELVVNVAPEIAIKGDPLLLEMLVNNLLDNAQKYSPKSAPITLQLQVKNEQALLSISDVGPGIPQEEQTKIFEKFYRIGNENTRTSKGTGLGLFLCKKIAEDHDGDISVTNNQPQGATFTVSIPLSI